MLGWLFDKIRTLIKSGDYRYRPIQPWEDRKWLRINTEDPDDIRVVDLNRVPRDALVQYYKQSGHDLDHADLPEATKNELADELEEDKPRPDKHSSVDDVTDANLADGAKDKARLDSLSRKPNDQVARDAMEHHQIMSDVLKKPALVGAKSAAGAVEFMADLNPSWGKLSNLPSDYGITSDADVDAETGETGETGDAGSDTGSDSGPAKVDVDTDTGTVTSADTDADTGSAGAGGDGVDVGGASGDGAGGGTSTGSGTGSGSTGSSSGTGTGTGTGGSSSGGSGSGGGSAGGANGGGV